MIKGVNQVVENRCGIPARLRGQSIRVKLVENSDVLASRLISNGQPSAKQNIRAICMFVPKGADISDEQFVHLFLLFGEGP